MNPVYKAKLTPKAQETLRAVQTLPQNILAGIALAMDLQNQFTISHIVRDYLSFPKDGPSTDIGLRVQSGRGRASIRASKAKVTGQAVQSAIGSNIGYMAAHEFGATIPAHDVVAKGGALRFRIGDRVLFRKKVHIPEVELPARAPVQHGIEDRLDDYSEAISAEIQKIWDGGKS
jgi:hypothetical protein